MSTRACYRFIDENGTWTVYKHHDGYPEGAVDFITAALDYAWPLPRFEADEFAAAFVAANKQGARDLAEDPYWKDKPRDTWMIGGGVRLVNSGDPDAFRTFASDIAYLYDITVKKGKLYVRAYEARCVDWDNVGTPEAWRIKSIFNSTLEAMQRKYQKNAA
jgi:hypothetical protein